MARVNEIRYVGYGVKDLEAERVFYRDDWGLREVAEQDGAIYLASQGQDEHHVVRLRGSDVNRIDVIALSAADTATVDLLHDQVAAAGAQSIFAPKTLTTPGAGYGFRFFSPDGVPFEVSSDVERVEARTVRPQEGIPDRISHVVLHSPKPKAMAQFFVDALGFRVSDWITEFMGFLGASPHRAASGAALSKSRRLRRRDGRQYDAGHRASAPQRHGRPLGSRPAPRRRQHLRLFHDAERLPG